MASNNILIDTSKYIHLVPEYLRGNEDFLLYFQLLVNEFNITLDNIEHFTDLVDPDKVPMKFIEGLGMYFNYHYNDRADDDFNRELLMRMRTIHEMRGTEHSIIMAASHGDNEGYVGGDIFIPGYPISQELAELTIARDMIFRHNVSNFSGRHVFSDKEWYRSGIIILSLSYINQDIRDKLDTVIPAGIKYKFIVMSNFIPDFPIPKNQEEWEKAFDEGKLLDEHGLLTWGPYNRIVPIIEKGDGKYSYNNPINLVYEMSPLVENKPYDILIHSDTRYGRPNHSGRIKLSVDNELLGSLGVSALPMSVLRKPFPFSDTQIHTEIPEKEPNPEPEPTPEEPEEIKTFTVSDEDGEHSSGSRFGGEFEDFDTETEQDYKEISYDDLPEEEQKEIDKNRDFYIISPTGEYLDRKDKLYTDSVVRKLDTTFNVDVTSTTRITARRSHHTGLRSGMMNRNCFCELKRQAANDKNALKAFPELAKYKNLKPEFNDRFCHCLGKMSGIFTGVYEEMVNIMDIPPFEVLYPASMVWELTPDGYRNPFYNSEFDIPREHAIDVASDDGTPFDDKHNLLGTEYDRIIEQAKVDAYQDRTKRFSDRTSGTYRSGRFILDIEREIVEPEDLIIIEKERMNFSDPATPHSGSAVYGGIKKPELNPEAIVDGTANEPDTNNNIEIDVNLYGNNKPDETVEEKAAFSLSNSQTTHSNSNAVYGGISNRSSSENAPSEQTVIEITVDTRKSETLKLSTINSLHSDVAKFGGNYTKPEPISKPMKLSDPDSVHSGEAVLSG